MLWLLLLFLCLRGADAAEDPEANMKTPQIIKYHGYPCQEVDVFTKDGYRLTMHRIPHGKNQTGAKGRPVMFLQHGLLGSSSNFITNLPDQALGFMAADAGFDVWLGNVRGNIYSIGHKTLDTGSRQFWKFTWDAMVKYDLPAMINKALNVSGQKHLYYAGHSQGTLIMFSHLSASSDFDQKIRQFHALAPVVTVKYIKGLIAILGHTMELEANVLGRVLGYNQFLPQDEVIKTAQKALCASSSLHNKMCGSLLGLVAGTDSSQLNETRIPAFLADMPGGTSTYNIMHWCQMVRTGLQQMFDFGTPQQNLAHYGQITPPVYDVSKIKVPMYLYRSNADWLATTEDNEANLLSKLNKTFLVKDNNLARFNHMDIVLGQRAPAEIFTPLINAALADAVLCDSRATFQNKSA